MVTFFEKFIQFVGTLAAVSLILLTPISALPADTAPACWPELAPYPRAVKFSDLKTIIQEKRIRTVDELVPHLGACRELWTAAYKSHSPEAHLVSGDAPRAILVCPDAKLTIAYADCLVPGSADGAHPECEEIQTASYEKEKVIFREVRLPGLQAKVGTPAIFSPDNTSTGPKKKVRSCSQCHREQSRWNWEPYNMWPGFYGSLTRLNTDIIRIGSPEETKYNSFLKRVWSAPAKHVRYTGLRWKLDGKDFNSKLLRSNVIPKLTASDSSRWDWFQKPIHGISSGSPNSKITLAFAELNFRRILYQIVSSPLYETYKAPIISALTGLCFDGSSIVGKANLPEMSRRVDAHFSMLKKDLDLENPPKPDDSFLPLHPLIGDDEAMSITSTLYAVAGILGVDPENFPTTPSGTPSFTVPTRVLNVFHSALQPYKEKCFPAKIMTCSEVFEALKPLLRH